MPTSQAECDALTPAQILRAAAQDARERAATKPDVRNDPTHKRLMETSRMLDLDADKMDPPRCGPLHIWSEVLLDGSGMIRLPFPILCF